MRSHFVRTTGLCCTANQCVHTKLRSEMFLPMLELPSSVYLGTSLEQHYLGIQQLNYLRDGSYDSVEV